METNSNQTVDLSETQKLLEEFLTTFLRLLIAAMAADMKKYSIESLHDYIGLLLLQYYLEKKRTEKQAFRK
jgi:hypothetical protein